MNSKRLCYAILSRCLMTKELTIVLPLIPSLGHVGMYGSIRLSPCDDFLRNPLLMLPHPTLPVEPRKQFSSNFREATIIRSEVLGESFTNRMCNLSLYFPT